MVSSNTSDLLVTAAVLCTSFGKITVVTSMPEVLPEAIPRSFKCTDMQTKLARLQKSTVQGNVA